MKEKKIIEEEVKLLHNDLHKDGMNRRVFLQKTSKLVGAAMGVSLVSSLGCFPVSAVSSSAIMKSSINNPCWVKH